MPRGVPGTREFRRFAQDETEFLITVRLLNLTDARPLDSRDRVLVTLLRSFQTSQQELIPVRNEQGSSGRSHLSDSMWASISECEFKDGRQEGEPGTSDG